MSIDLKDIMEFLQNPDNKSKLDELLKMPVVKKRGRPKKVQPKQEDEEVVDLSDDTETDSEVVDDNVKIVDLTRGKSGSSKKGKLCRRVAIGTSKRKNKFIDDRHESLEDYELFDKKVLGGVKDKVRRKKKVIKYKVKCRECKDTFIVDEQPFSYEPGQDGSATYVCDSCIPGR